MTLKTSFFNKGIYKSTLKRYMWGSVLYFVLLFIITGLAIFLTYNLDDMSQYSYYKINSLILSGSYMIMPMLLVLAVPTVTAILTFRHIHSKKQAIFIHSLPVSRRANYISNLLAAFTLMLVPVIINGLVLMLMSVCRYEKYFTVHECTLWILYNSFGLFLMFSCAVFSASITGNGFATVVINILVHGFLIIIVSAFEIMADAFLYGFAGSNAVSEAVGTNNFVSVVFGFADVYYRDNLTVSSVALYIAAALVIYAISYIFCVKRKAESASEVAGFKCLNIIFKYLVTFVAALYAFAVFSSNIGENTFAFTSIIVIMSLIAYTASEMLLKKTLNVFYAWKGYVCFALVFAAIVAAFAFTSFFGYETRVPEKAEIEQVAVYDYFMTEDEPFAADDELFDTVIGIHKELVRDSLIPALNDAIHYEPVYINEINIKYRLKNGGVLHRRYPVPSEQLEQFMTALYESEQYKKSCEPIFIDDSAISEVHVGWRNVENYRGLIEALREDTLNLSYAALKAGYDERPPVLYSVTIDYRVDKEVPDVGTAKLMDKFEISVTSDYEKTVAYIQENIVNSQ